MCVNPYQPPNSFTSVTFCLPLSDLFVRLPIHERGWGWVDNTAGTWYLHHTNTRAIHNENSHFPEYHLCEGIIFYLLELPILCFSGGLWDAIVSQWVSKFVRLDVWGGFKLPWSSIFLPLFRPFVIGSDDSWLDHVGFALLLFRHYFGPIIFCLSLRHIDGLRAAWNDTRLQTFDAFCES